MYQGVQSIHVHIHEFTYMYTCAHTYILHTYMYRYTYIHTCVQIGKQRFVVCGVATCHIVITVHVVCTWLHIHDIHTCTRLTVHVYMVLFVIIMQYLYSIYMYPTRSTLGGGTCRFQNVTFLPLSLSNRTQGSNMYVWCVAHVCMYVCMYVCMLYMLYVLQLSCMYVCHMYVTGYVWMCCHVHVHMYM